MMECNDCTETEEFDEGIKLRPCGCYLCDFCWEEGCLTHGDDVDTPLFNEIEIHDIGGDQ